MKRIFSILTPPKFENPDDTRQGAYVHYICAAMFVGFFIAIIHDHLFGIRPISFLLYFSEVGILFVTMINKKGFIRTAMLLLVLINLIITTTFMVLADGTHDEIIIVFPIILFVSSLLFDNRILMSTLITILAIVWVIGLLEINDVIVNKFSANTTLIQLIYTSLILTISVFVIDLIAGDLKKIIRDLKQKTFELEIANKNLNKSNSTKDKFVSILAHDLRSPFQGILGISNILEFEDAELTETERKDFISRLNKNLNRQYNFLEELLLWGKIQEGLIEFIPRVCNVRSIINDNVDVLSGNIARKKLNVLLHGPETVNAILDDNLISTVIRNLLSNAIKFTPVGGEINIYLEEFPNFFCIKIADKGIGIPMRVQKKLFGIETNISTRGTEDESGSGLGLILCKEIIDKHGGHILLESEEGKGSTFSITLAKDIKPYLPEKELLRVK